MNIWINLFPPPLTSHPLPSPHVKHEWAWVDEEEAASLGVTRKCLPFVLAALWTRDVEWQSQPPNASFYDTVTLFFCYWNICEDISILALCSLPSRVYTLLGRSVNISFHLLRSFPPEGWCRTLFLRFVTYLGEKKIGKQSLSRSIIIRFVRKTNEMCVA